MSTEVLWKLDEWQIESLRKLLSWTQNTSLSLFETLSWDNELSELVFSRIVQLFESMSPEQIVDRFRSSDASDKFVMEILSIIDKDAYFQSEIEKRIVSRWDSHYNLIWWSKSLLVMGSLFLVMALVKMNLHILTDEPISEFHHLWVISWFWAAWLFFGLDFFMRFQRYLDKKKFVSGLRHLYLKPQSN